MKQLPNIQQVSLNNIGIHKHASFFLYLACRLFKLRVQISLNKQAGVFLNKHICMELAFI